MVTTWSREPARWIPPDAIAFVAADKRGTNGISRLLRRAVGEVAVVDSLQDLGDVSNFALVAVFYEELSPEEQSEIVADFSARTGRPTLLLLSERCLNFDFATLFNSRILTNVLMVDANGPDIGDLLVTVQKIRHRDIFGLEKYFVWGVEPRSLSLNSSQEKPQVIAAINDFAAGIGVPTRLRALIRTVADEFLSNALYNAPVTADGSNRYARLPRTVPVQLEPHERIEVRFCCDGRRFGLSTSDPFGSLQPVILQEYLARAFRNGEDQVAETPGGAGLGFYQILDSLSHFVVNIDPGRRTEVIGLVDVSGSYRTFASGGKSFNIFVTERAR